MRLIDFLFAIIFSGIVTYLSWKVIPGLDEAHVQGISSTVSTISGILFGFVMASATLLISAKDNTLVKNAQIIGYLPKLLKKLRHTMAYLLAVCITFLICLFIPETMTLSSIGLTYDLKVKSLVILIGVFVFCMAFCCFILVWREFSKFSENM